MCFQSSNVVCSDAFLLNVSLKGWADFAIQWEITVSLTTDLVSFFSLILLICFSLSLSVFYPSFSFFYQLCACRMVFTYKEYFLFNSFCIFPVRTCFPFAACSSQSQAAWRDNRPHGAQRAHLQYYGKSLHTGQPQSMSCLSYAHTTNMLTGCYLRGHREARQLARFSWISEVKSKTTY